VVSWLDAPLDVHTVRYEDMLADPEACLGAAARFLGIEADAATVARAVGAVSFERLAEQERAAGGFREALRPGQTFFRQGRAGAWREALPDALARRIEADHGAVMRRLGYL
jgi:aryl sulfotransferase